MDLHSRWTHRWLNPKTDSFESPIHGLGVVANADMKKGEVIMVYGGIVVPRREIREYRKEGGHAGIQLSEDFFMVPASREELQTEGIINHSCDPNVGFRSQVELVAMRDINKGEEIFLDYAFVETDFDSFDCHCGSANCRARVSPDDWKRKNLQERIGDYFSPYLKAKLKEVK
ncbi:MAG: SET domain-containing protein-lysine N-methyltransferase [Patescibacteria group bacterium]